MAAISMLLPTFWYQKCTVTRLVPISCLAHGLILITCIFSTYYCCVCFCFLDRISILCPAMLCVFLLSIGNFDVQLSSYGSVNYKKGNTHVMHWGHLFRYCGLNDRNV